MMTCAEVRDVAPELALGVLGGAERAETLAHVDDCAQCRSLVGELTDAGELLPLLAGEAEPSPGFEARVLAAVGGGRKRARLRGLTVVAATAAAAAIVSVATVRVVDRGRDDPIAVGSTVSEVKSAPMIGSGGAAVGWAFVSDGQPAAVGVSVGYLLPSGTYTIEAIRGDDGTSVDLGTVEVVDGRGVWAGAVDAPEEGFAFLTLVDGAGTPVCQAAISF